MIRCRNLAIDLASRVQLGLDVGSESWRGKTASFIELGFQAIDPLQEILGILHRSDGFTCHGHINWAGVSECPALSIGTETEPATSVDPDRLFQRRGQAVRRDLTCRHDYPVIDELRTIQRRPPNRGSAH